MTVEIFLVLAIAVYLAISFLGVILVIAHRRRLLFTRSEFDKARGEALEKGLDIGIKQGNKVAKETQVIADNSRETLAAFRDLQRSTALERTEFLAKLPTTYIADQCIVHAAKYLLIAYDAGSAQAIAFGVERLRDAFERRSRGDQINLDDVKLVAPKEGGA